MFSLGQFSSLQVLFWLPGRLWPVFPLHLVPCFLLGNFHPCKFSSGSQVVFGQSSHFTWYHVFSWAIFIPLIQRTTQSVFGAGRGFFGFISFSAIFRAASSSNRARRSANSISVCSRASSRALLPGSYSTTSSSNFFDNLFGLDFLFRAFSPGTVNLPAAPFPLVCKTSPFSTDLRMYFLILGA